MYENITDVQKTKLFIFQQYNYRCFRIIGNVVNSTGHKNINRNHSKLILYKLIPELITLFFPWSPEHTTFFDLIQDRIQFLVITQGSFYGGKKFV